MIINNIKRNFLTASELVKVKTVSLNDNKALCIYRNAFVKQCEQGLTFAQLKSRCKNGIFRIVSASRYKSAIYQILLLAGVKLVSSQKWCCANPKDSQNQGICVFRTVVTEDMGYYTHVECKNFFAKNAKRLLAHPKSKDTESWNAYMSVFEAINEADRIRNEDNVNAYPSSKSPFSCSKLGKGTYLINTLYNNHKLSNPQNRIK